jgi:hypothetical protein
MAYRKVQNAVKKEHFTFKAVDDEGKEIDQSFDVEWRVPTPSRMQKAIDINERMVDLMYAHLVRLNLDGGSWLDATQARAEVAACDDPYLTGALMASFMDSQPTSDSFRRKPA